MAIMLRKGWGYSMHNSANLLHIVLRSTHDAVITTDAEGRVQSINPAAEAMTGWLEDEAIGAPVEAAIDLREGLEERASEVRLPSPVYAAMRSGVRVELPGEALLIGKSGLRTAVEVSASPLLESDGALSGAVLVLHDLSEALQLANRKYYLAHHDPLTALPNRILLVDRMEQATKFADRHSDQMAILSLDIDHFTWINETHGEAAGDELLKEVSFRITGTLRESDTVCRLGADDFVVLLPGVTSRGDVESLAAKLLRVVGQPYTVKGSEIAATCSIGISLYPQDAIDAGTLMRLADASLMQAKRAGRGCYWFSGIEKAVGD
jgi:diguanylate cyclase (GGDEF)-like protein/PAS domain S-box-containing protein